MPGPQLRRSTRSTNGEMVFDATGPILTPSVGSRRSAHERPGIYARENNNKNTALPRLRSGCRNLALAGLPPFAPKPNPSRIRRPGWAPTVARSPSDTMQPVWDAALAECSFPSRRREEENSNIKEVSILYKGIGCCKVDGGGVYTKLLEREFVEVRVSIFCSFLFAPTELWNSPWLFPMRGASHRPRTYAVDVHRNA